MHTFLKRRQAIALFALLGTAALPAGASTAPTPTSQITGFGGFALNGNSGGYDGQDATAHGVPTINGGTLHLTTPKGVVDSIVYNGVTYSTFFGSENTSAYYTIPQNITRFTASFTYHYNGTNPLSFGPGNGISFILQDDSRGLTALGNDGDGNGGLGEYGGIYGTVSPSAALEFQLFTGFGDPRGTRLAVDGDPGIGVPDIHPTGSINLISGHPIAVSLVYDGTTLSQTLTDKVTHAVSFTYYAIDLPAAVGASTAFVGFTGGTGAAVADQTITDFTFNSNGSIPPPPVNAGPKLTVTASGAYNPGGDLFVNIVTTNIGGISADFVQITGITLDGAVPIAPPVGDIHNVLPTIPNLLSPSQSQNSTFVYSGVSGKTHLVRASGIYIDPITHGTGHFSGSVRLTLP